MDFFLRLYGILGAGTTFYWPFMHQAQAHSPLLNDYLSELTRACRKSGGQHLPVLDLACGSGRNGLYLVKNGLPVMFADINEQALSQIEETVGTTEGQGHASYWHQDFELPGTAPLEGKTFAAIMVFRYLHRPLMAQLKQAVQPGGLIIYETFTRTQAQFGRPKNPDFLLAPGELAGCFADWHVCHHFEGIVEFDGVKQAIAQLVAVKPDES